MKNHVLVLEVADLMDHDDALNSVTVDKDIFDDFDEDSIIEIQWIDIEGEPIFEYQMVEETDDGIIMTIFA